MHRHPEALAILALLVPWAVLSAFLPMPQALVATGLLSALGALLFTLARWARLRAAVLDLDPERWALTVVLTLGYGSLLLLGTKSAGSGFQALCHDCGNLFDARHAFCYGCGSYS